MLVECDKTSLCLLQNVWGDRSKKTSILKFGIKAEMVKSHVFTGHEGIPFFNEEFNLQHKINFVIQIVFTFG